jgi:hypothetical protein
MRLIFHHPVDFIGHGICWKTAGRYSHVSFVLDGWEYESVCLGGVRRLVPRPVPDGGLAIDREFSPEATDRMVAFAEKCVKEERGYDFRAILAFMVNSTRQDARRYFCSELAYDVLRAGDPTWFPAVDWLVSPEDLRRQLVLSVRSE